MGKKKNKKSDAELSALTQQKKALHNQIKRLQSKIMDVRRLADQKKRRQDALVEIENSYKRRGMAHLLKLNKTYTDLKETLKLTNTESFGKELSNFNKKLSKTRDRLRDTDARIVARQQQIDHQKQKQIERQKQNEVEQQKIVDKNNVASSHKQKKKKEKNKKKKILEPSRKRESRATTEQPKFSPLYLPSFTRSKITIEPDWEDISFADGFITIKHGGHWYRKDVAQSKKYLNEIKHYYKFHNIPRLKVVVSGSEIKAIENQEVLFYHIDFLNIAAANFGFIKLDPFRLTDWQKYTKQYYDSKLPFVFHTHTLRKLCEYCDPNAPIIPVGEAVINSYGSKTIHNSFLFPMTSKNGHFIVWESIQEAKASYVFLLNSFTDNEVQILFDYIAGDTPNKRWTLINSRHLQEVLRLKTRILHTDLWSWEYEIQQFCVL